MFHMANANLDLDSQTENQWKNESSKNVKYVLMQECGLSLACLLVIVVSSYQ